MSVPTLYTPTSPAWIPRDDIEVVVVDRVGNRLKQIPSCIVDSIEWDLNDVDTASISFPAIAENLVDRTTAPPTVYPRLRRDEIQIWYKQQLMFWGVPWRRRVTSQDGKCQITCEGILSYLKQLFVSNSSIDFSGGLEQANIAVGILEYAQGHGFGNQQPNRELNITYPFLSPTGHVRARLYDREQHANLLDLLKEFPTLKDGFDWALIPYADGRREFTIFYPQRGSRRANLVIEMRRNLGDLTFDEDATKLVNESWFSGASDGILKVENTWIDTASANFYGIAQHFSSDSTEYDVQWLLSEAQHETETYASPAITPEITALPTPVALLGVLVPGDTVPVRIDDGQVQVRDDYRITKITWAPGNGTGGSGSGGDTLKIDCLAKRAVTPVAVPVTSPNPKATEPQTYWFPPDDRQIESYGASALGGCVYPTVDPAGIMGVPGTYNNIYWGTAPLGYWYNFEYNLTIDIDVEPGVGAFWSCQFWFVNGSGGYIGMQTSAGSGGGGPLQKDALFSIWDAIGATAGPGGTAGPFGGEGTGYHASLPLEWIPGRTYRLGVWINGADGSGNWIWEGYVTDTVTNINYVIGDITVPAAWSVGGGEHGYLAGQHLHWIEFFSGPPVVQCSDVPLMSGTFTDFQADQGTYGKAHPTSDGPYFGTPTQCGNSRICAVPGGRRMQLGGLNTYAPLNSPYHGSTMFSQQFEILENPVVDQYVWETLLNYYNQDGILKLQVLPAQSRTSATKGLRVIASNAPPRPGQGAVTATSPTGTVTTVDANHVTIDMTFTWAINTLYTWEVTRDFGTNTWKVVIDDGTTKTTVAEVTMPFLDGLEQDATNTTYLSGTFAQCSYIEQSWVKSYAPYIDGLLSDLHNNIVLESNGCNNTLVEDIDSSTVQHIVGVT